MGHLDAIEVGVGDLDAEGVEAPERGVRRRPCPAGAQLAGRESLPFAFRIVTFAPGPMSS
jgi:hypothetical protein